VITTVNYRYVKSSKFGQIYKVLNGKELITAMPYIYADFSELNFWKWYHRLLKIMSSYVKTYLVVPILYVNELIL
jgi:hypothetical protein